MDIENNSAFQLVYFKWYIGDMVTTSYMRFGDLNPDMKIMPEHLFSSFQHAQLVSSPITVVLPMSYQGNEPLMCTAAII